MNGQLQIWATLREAYAIFFTELPTFLRIGIKPFVCLFALMGLFTVLKIQSPGSFSLTLLISVLALIFIGALALSPHRLREDARHLCAHAAAGGRALSGRNGSETGRGVLFVALIRY